MTPDNKERRPLVRTALPDNDTTTVSPTSHPEPAVHNAEIIRAERYVSCGQPGVLVVVRCPECGRRHFHGWRDELPVVDNGAAISKCSTYGHPRTVHYRFVYPTTEAGKQAPA